MNTLNVAGMEMYHYLGEDVQDIINSFLTLAKLDDKKIDCSIGINPIGESTVTIHFNRYRPNWRALLFSYDALSKAIISICELTGGVSEPVNLYEKNVGREQFDIFMEKLTECIYGK